MTKYIFLISHNISYTILSEQVYYELISFQSHSHVRLFVTPWTVAHQASLSITNSWRLLKLMSITSVMPPTHFVLCPFSFCLQSFPASGSFPMSQFFASGSQRIGASASASVLPMNIQDWFPLGLIGCFPCSQGTLKSLLQHHSSKASMLQYSAFFIVQLLHPYMTLEKS